MSQLLASCVTLGPVLTVSRTEHGNVELKLAGRWRFTMGVTAAHEMGRALKGPPVMLVIGRPEAEARLLESDALRLADILLELR